MSPLNIGWKATHNTSGDVGVLDSPSQSQRAHCAAQLFRNLGHLLNLFNPALSLGRFELLDLVLHCTFVGGVSRVGSDTVVVLSGKDTAFKRGPNGATPVSNVSMLVEEMTDEPRPKFLYNGAYSSSNRSR